MSITKAGLPVLLALAASLFATGPPAQSPQTPVFRSAVDLVAVDVQVVNRDGNPIETLGIDDFRVFFNGHARQVVSVDFIRKQPVLPPESGGPELPIITPGIVPPGARVFVLAVDSNSLGANAMKPVARAAQQFLRTLAPDDLAALYVYPFDRPIVNVTHDHYAVGRAVDRVIGQYQPFAGAYGLTVSEAIDISANDGETFARVVARECRGEIDPTKTDPSCGPKIHMEADSQAAYYETQGKVALRNVSLLLRALAELPGRKTVLLVSGGMPATDRVGGRPSLAESMMSIGAEAGAANANIYTVHVDNSFSDPLSSAMHASRDPGDRARSTMRDTQLLGIGLDRLAGATGGALLRDPIGSGEMAFRRVLRESSSYYLLGVRPVAQDRDGRLHFLRVSVGKRGLTVRSRTQVVIPRS